MLICLVGGGTFSWINFDANRVLRMSLRVALLGSCIWAFMFHTHSHERYGALNVESCALQHLFKAHLLIR